MKSLINTILSLSLLVLLSGCSGFLDKYPHGKWTSHNYDIDGETSDIPYDALIEGELQSAYNNQHIYGICLGIAGMHSITTDDAEKGSTATDISSAIPLKAHTYDAGNGIISGYYSGWYTIINYVNRAMKYVSVAEEYNKVPADVLNYQKAQCYALRAHAYFRLIQAYGAVSYVDHVLEQSESTPVRSEPETVYPILLQQLEWSVPYLRTRLENQAEGTFGKITKNGALALMAKIQLYRKNWQEAYDLTEQIITSGDNDLSTPFEKIFTEEYEFGPESVWEDNAVYDKLNAIYTSPNSQWAQIQGFRGTPNNGWGANGPSKALREAMKDDPRYPSTVLTEGDVVDGIVCKPGANQPNPYFNRKVYASVAEKTALGRNNAQGQWINIRYIRYSDVILMNAEAACESGNVEEALNKLEMVRSRARGGDSSALPKIKTTDQTELRKAIHQERRFELAMELERFFDLVRWGEAPTEITGFIEGKHELFPIPQKEIDASNGILTQNPGY